MSNASVALLSKSKEQQQNIECYCFLHVSYSIFVVQETLWVNKNIYLLSLVDIYYQRYRNRSVTWLIDRWMIHYIAAFTAKRKWNFVLLNPNVSWLANYSHQLSSKVQTINFESVNLISATIRAKVWRLSLKPDWQSTVFTFWWGKPRGGCYTFKLSNHLRLNSMCTEQKYKMELNGQK